MPTRFAISLATLAVCLVSSTSCHATILAGWVEENIHSSDFNFGYPADGFPQAKDTGVSVGAFFDIAPAEATLDSDGFYLNVRNFAGTNLGDLASIGGMPGGPGGAFAFIGNQSNGSQALWTVPTSGYKDILVSWAQRGTATGFWSRKFEYSTDGGATYTDIGPYTDALGQASSGMVLSVNYTTVSLDLTAVTALNDNPSVKFRITYDGAVSNAGNNRWDNFYVQGTAIPEPAGMVLISLGAIGLIAFTRRK